MEYYVYRTDELTHHGVLGMKWGIRRYQRKDGSLTPAGKKRRAKLEAELDKLGGKKDTDDTPRKKSISEMSNKELQEHTTRMQLEKNYYDAKKQLAAANPKQVSAGQKFANKMLNDVITPALTNAGKTYIEKMIKEKAGIKDDVKINWDDMLKKQTYEKNEKNKVYEDLKRQNDIETEKEKQRKKKVDSEATKTKSAEKTDTSTNSQKHESGSSKTEKSKVYEGTVEGTGTSKKNNSSKQSSKNDTVIDADWSEVEVSSVPATVTNRGQSYVTALLESPDRWDDD